MNHIKSNSTPEPTPESAFTIENGVLEDFLDDSLTTVVIPNSVTEIGHDAFLNCGTVVSVVIPDSVTTIIEDAFFHCASLHTLGIPASVTEIGNHAFDDCPKLTSVTVVAGSYGEAHMKEKYPQITLVYA